MEKWYIKFTNGYNNSNVNDVRRILGDDFHRYVEVGAISGKVVDVVMSDTEDEAMRELYYLVGMLEGMCMSMDEADPACRLIQYLYDAYSLAEVVSYIKKEDN